MPPFRSPTYDQDVHDFVCLFVSCFSFFFNDPFSCTSCALSTHFRGSSGVVSSEIVSPEEDGREIRPSPGSPDSAGLKWPETCHERTCTTRLSAAACRLPACCDLFRPFRECSRIHSETSLGRTLRSSNTTTLGPPSCLKSPLPAI